MGTIVSYFPTEINVLYTSVIAAVASSDTSSRAGQWSAFLLLLALTPCSVWVVYAARAKA